MQEARGCAHTTAASKEVGGLKVLQKLYRCAHLQSDQMASGLDSRMLQFFSPLHPPTATLPGCQFKFSQVRSPGPQESRLQGHQTAALARAGRTTFPAPSGWGNP